MKTEHMVTAGIAAAGGVALLYVLRGIRGEEPESVDLEEEGHEAASDLLTGEVEVNTCLRGAAVPAEKTARAMLEAQLEHLMSERSPAAPLFDEDATGVARITPECLLPLLRIWLDAWGEAHKASRERYRILRAAPTPVMDLDPPPGKWRAKDLRAFMGVNSPRSALGELWDSLRGLEVLATRTLLEGGEALPWVHTPFALRTLRRFADELDKASVSTEANVLLMGLERMGRNMDQGLSVVLDKVVPFLGGRIATVLASVAPYAVVAVCGYVVIRRIS